jgi:pyruvate kinase
MNPDTQSRTLEFRRLFDQLTEIRAEMHASEQALGPAHTGLRRKSLSNLMHYLALRRRDVRPLQEELSRVGLSSLGRCEAHALCSVDAVLRLLGRLLGEEPTLTPSAGAPDFDEAYALLETNTRALFGPPPDGRAVRIMVTLSSEAAADEALARELIDRGADVVRINCARDDAPVWERMVDHVRAASQKLSRPCKIHFDLGGPKLRTGAAVQPISLGGGDCVVLTRSQAAAAIAAPPRIPCTIPSVLDTVRVGEPVWFDDGKLGGVVQGVSDEGITVRVTYARRGRRELLPGRGINFPETAIHIPGFTARDREDLAFVVRHADSVGLSFAQRTEDIRDLRMCLAELGADRLGVILKIETRRGFEALPHLLIEDLGEHPLGVMIARGDLALEVGYERLAEVQEEILWVCEAAHTPVIWATQVLESLSKDGMPTRAEITDAAMSERAECVMLNKGKHVVDAVRILDDILRRMQSHQHKKSATLRPLRISRGPAVEPARAKD